MSTAVWSIPATPESVSEVREDIGRFARRHGADAEVEARVLLAVSEAVSNAVLHAYPAGEEGVIDIRAEHPAGEIVVEVVDRGGGVRPRADSPGVGLGLPLIARLADRFSVTEVGGTAVCMAFATSGTR